MLVCLCVRVCACVRACYSRLNYCGASVNERGCKLSGPRSHTPGKSSVTVPSLAQTHTQFIQSVNWRAVFYPGLLRE